MKLKSIISKQHHQTTNIVIRMVNQLYSHPTLINKTNSLLVIVLIVFINIQKQLNVYGFTNINSKIVFHGLPSEIPSLNTPNQKSKNIKSQFVYSTCSLHHFQQHKSLSIKKPSYTQTRLNESIGDNDNKKQNDSKRISPFRKAIKKFQSKPGTYLLIPIIAAFVGWFTNWLAVQMIFYPIEFRGIPLYLKPEVPLGLLGWQGIVPCKTRPMSESMVHMVTTQLLSVKEVFKRLNPNQVASLLSPEVPKLVESIMSDVIPKKRSWILSLPSSLYSGLSENAKELIAHYNHNFLRDFTISMQNNIDSLLNVRNCVVNQMMLDRTMLGKLFWKCGKKELDFLTNSGLWFGFLLGLIQMVVALFWENPWSLSIGGGIVGLATNWLALKWIFEPVNPTKVGPFILQGQFLRRQKEVAVEFSNFFANNILTSEKMFSSILNDPETKPVFHKLFSHHLTKFATTVSSGLGMLPEPEVLKMAATRAVEKLPNHIGVLHSYVDEKLQLQKTLQISMEGMTSAQFERVLHPIFEEDELTLIIAGAVLGFAAGLVQQGIETGSLKVPNLGEVISQLKNIARNLRSSSPRKIICNGYKCIQTKIRKILNKKGPEEEGSRTTT